MFSCLADFPYRLYIFSEQLGNNEGGEVEKILYGYPSSRNIDDQLKDVGLSEAFFRFYNTFAPLGKYRFLRTADGRMALYSPEPSIWLCLIIKFPLVRPDSSAGASCGTLVHTGGFVADSVLSTILEVMYQLWALHYDSVTTILNQSGPMDCRYHLKDFFDRLIGEVHSFSWSLLDTFTGVSFLPLERVTYLKIHSFLNRLECSFQQVATSMFFHSNYLTWSGLNQEDTKTLYFYASRFLAKSDLDSQNKKPQNVNGRFLQPIFCDGGSLEVVQKAYLTSFPDKNPVSLLAYKILSTMVFVVIPNNEDVTEEFVRELSNFFSDYLLILASDLAKSCVPVSNSALAKEDPNFKFIYYNSSNSALKSTIHDEKTRQIDRSLVSSDAVTRMMMMTDYLAPIDPIEVATSVSTDTWVVLKKAAQRQLLLVVSRQRGTCTLIHVSDELRKLSSSIFSDILFLEI